MDSFEQGNKNLSIIIEVTNKQNNGEIHYYIIITNYTQIDRSLDNLFVNYQLYNATGFTSDFARVAIETAVNFEFHLEMAFHL